MDKRIKVVLVEAGKPPYVKTIGNSIESMQKAVGGDIQMLGLSVGETLVCNDEGKLLGLAGNRRIGDDIIAGTFFITGDNEDGELVSLNDEQIYRYTQMFKEPEIYSAEDVQKALKCEITGFDPENPPQIFKNADEQNDVFIEKLNSEIVPYIDYEKLDQSYKSTDKTYAKEVLKAIHNKFMSVYNTDTIEESDEIVTLPAVIKGINTGKICVGVVDIDLESSGEHWGTGFLTKHGLLQQGSSELTKTEKQFIDENFIPYVYAYTIGVENDIHVNINNLPSDMKEFLQFCHEEQNNETRYELIEVLDKKALFTNERLTAEDVPDGLYCYHLREADNGNGFATIEPNVGVNHGGTVITSLPIDFGTDGYIAFDDDTSPNFLGDSITIQEYMQTDFEQEQTGGMKLC
ncbi:MAG: hypothetical protein BWY15_02457 [Firmicutes bacterium ADurb.Bin193]|nr:MAG: hypothetical protein BWY15_02457 [Firmicutes bacterium ADurb.Bin193]